MPPAPASVSAPASVVLNITFTVSWSAASTATSYTLRQTEVDAGRVNVKYTGPNTSTTTSIALAGFYQYAVQACNAAGCSGWTSAGLTDAEPRGGPKAVRAGSGP